MALNGHLLIVLLVIAILVGFVSGLYPAVTISRFQPIMALKGFSNNIWGEHKFSLRKILIAVQFVIALIILSSTIITKRQFDFLQQKNLGFETDQILAITNSPWDVQDEYKNFRYEIERIPGVAGVTANMEVPSREIRDTGAIRFEDFHEENDEIIMDIQIADSNYIEFMGMRLPAGRNFSTYLGSGEFPPDGSPNEAYYEYANSARREYIINETALGLLGISDARDALGKKFGWGNGILKLQDGPIVGVVEDSHQETLRNKVDPLAVVYEPMFLRTFLIKLESENIQESLSGIDNVWKQMFPSYPMESAFLDDLFGQLYRSEQRQKETLSIFSSVIIIIALLGLLGLLSFMIQRRMKELAIRKILGASKISLLYLFGKNFVVQALIALCIAAPVTVYFMRGWLENFAYRTSITGMEFFLSFIALLSVLGITLLVQVGKSANLNPVETLRYE